MVMTEPIAFPTLRASLRRVRPFLKLFDACQFVDQPVQQLFLDLMKAVWCVGLFNLANHVAFVRFAALSHTIRIFSGREKGLQVRRGDVSHLGKENLDLMVADTAMFYRTLAERVLLHHSSQNVRPFCRQE